MTITELETLRDGFWHAHLGGHHGGRPDVWQGLKMAAEALDNGDGDTAQAICEACFFLNFAA